MKLSSLNVLAPLFIGFALTATPDSEASSETASTISVKHSEDFKGLFNCRIQKMILLEAADGEISSYSGYKDSTQEGDYISILIEGYSTGPYQYTEVTVIDDLKPNHLQLLGKFNVISEEDVSSLKVYESGFSITDRNHVPIIRYRKYKTGETFAFEYNQGTMFGASNLRLASYDQSSWSGIYSTNTSTIRLLSRNENSGRFTGSKSQTYGLKCELIDNFDELFYPTQ